MKPIVIIGGVAAGMSAASVCKRLAPETEVIVFEKGDFISYGACGMPYVLSGDIGDWRDLIVLTPEEARGKRALDVRLNTEAVSINPANHSIEVRNREKGTTFVQPYEKLVLASGAGAVLPDFPNRTLPGIFPLKEMNDLISLENYISSEKPQKCIIVGGGYIGLESAEALTRRGLQVTVIEALPRVMNTMDADFSALAGKELEAHGVRICTNTKVTGFGGNARVEKVYTDTDTALSADLVLLSLGVYPESGLAEKAGLMLSEKKAVKVDKHLKTSDPDIYAAGDCTAVRHFVLARDVFIPLALGANRQGRMAGENIAAEILKKPLKSFPPILGTAVTKIFSLGFGKTGIGKREIESYQITDIMAAEAQSINRAGYYPGSCPFRITLYFSKFTHKILGAQIAGTGDSVLRIDALAAAVQGEMTIEELYSLDTAYAPPYSPVWDPILMACRMGLKKLNE